MDREVVPGSLQQSVVDRYPSSLIVLADCLSASHGCDAWGALAREHAWIRAACRALGCSWSSALTARIVARQAGAIGWLEVEAIQRAVRDALSTAPLPTAHEVVVAALDSQAARAVSTGGTRALSAR